MTLIASESISVVARKVRSARAARPSADRHTIVRLVAEALTDNQRWDLVLAAIEVDVVAFDRGRVRTIERASVVSRGEVRSANPDFVQRAISEVSAIRELAESAARDMTVALTQELLNSSVRLGDGTEVLIGDATPDQRGARIEMLEAHAQGGLDTLTFEIALLNKQGRQTLREVSA